MVIFLLGGATFVTVLSEGRARHEAALRRNDPLGR
jgi:hypothetical protein